MKGRQANRAYVTVVNIAQHIKSFYKRQNHATGVILPTGEHQYFIHGQVVTPEEFNEVFPIVPLKANGNKFGENLDGRQVKKH